MTEAPKTQEGLKPLAVGKREAARMLGISVRTLENYATAKRIETRRFGSRRLVLLRSLERFVSRDQPSVSHSCRSRAEAREVRG
jgi:hypothetical protein